MEGRTLSHYHVLEKIGAGGMGVVYRAHDERLDRDVALKVLPGGLLSDEGARRRFRKEALALSRLNHPNIATVYDFDTQEGVDFLVMEYLAGETLAQKLAGGPLPEEEVTALGAQIASALEGANEQGVVHRDLKPGNIIVTPRGSAKVLDFGLATLLRPEGEASQVETKSQAYAAVGTLPYMAPEQLRGEKVDARSDLYAAGAVLYEMATGRRPFPEAHAPVLIDAILNRAPEPPRHLNPRISAGLEGIILKALEKKPEHRQQSASEFEKDLERLGRPVSWTARWAHGLFGTRARTIAVVLGVALVLALGALVSGVLHRPNESLDVLMKEHRRARAVGEASESRIATLAVLPMVNLSGDPAQDYFADGLTEELITALTNISTLHVISRDSVMRYKNTRKSIPEIARELGVEDVIESSVRRSERRVRVTAQLVEAVTNRNLWAEIYDRDLRDVLSIQGEVARAIAQEIRVKVTPQENARLGAPRAVSLEAHDAYLRGRFHLNSFNVDGGRKAMDYFKQALGIDPNYALAWVGLADSYLLLSEMFLPPNEALPRAKA
ncbi:MAG TPA: serine/threonine-protein kinase, partial [Candidatus Polarisedimenticolia bacterium]|nr:serine/threonine-protein kinase [Candidatus Polarisedimenticolia bacterium]